MSRLPPRWPTALRTLTPSDARWPADLGSLAEPPAQLRIAGTLPALDRAVAIVGTRHADEDGLGFAQNLAAELASRGCPIVSGGARGIDAAAHRGALDAGGTTLAVLASGLGRPYPARHGPLFERIARAGAVLSEGDDARIPHRGRFLERNRLIAALARAVVVVQAPIPSGALSTAAHARALGRAVLAVPAGPTDPRGAGCIALLRQGAVICTRARDVLSVAALGGHSADGGADSQESPDMMEETAQQNAGQDAAANAAADMDDDGRAVWACLGSRPRHVDELARRSGLPAARTQRALVGLMLLGLADEREGGRYVQVR